MNRIVSLALLGLVRGTDLCAMLCERHGSSVYTGGSWNHNGYCKKYPRVEGGSGHCYHTSATAHVCPGSPALRADEAEAILAQSDSASRGSFNILFKYSLRALLNQSTLTVKSQQLILLSLIIRVRLMFVVGGWSRC